MSSVLKRLYVFTGKGGVGKTTLSLSFAKLLQSMGENVLYNNMNQITDKELLKNLSINCLNMDVYTSIQKYIAKKMNSQIIASWITNTSFAKSMFNIVPSVGYMIYLGHLIWMLEEQKDLIIVLDAPASGHATTMLESPFNFKKIFLSGVLEKDITRMIDFITNPSSLSVIISNLPNPLSVSEGFELKKDLESLHISSINMVMNSSFTEINKIKDINILPKFIKKKIQLENKVFKEYKSSFLKMPYIINNSQKEIIDSLEPLTEIFK